VSDIQLHGFQDVADGEYTFKNIQPRDHNDEFAKFVSTLFGSRYKVNLNFVRKSPHKQTEPNFIHTDEMMGDITCILYLNEEAPEDDGTTIYDEDKKPLLTMYSKFNRMIAFNSDAAHSRNIFQNFGQGDKARLVQIIFLRETR
jgi:hypothetical protein